MTVVGLGIEGVDLVRYLAAEGARVTVSDRRPATELEEQLGALEGCDFEPSLGENREDVMTAAEYLFVSQGVPADLPPLQAAARAGVPVSSMTQLFLERCPAPVAGITGSAGKTTTTALVGAMLDAAGADHVVGGNIGVGLLSLLERITPATTVVVELSHTQLASVDRSPHVACVTNVTPNHLDRFTWTDYVGLKRRAIAFQGADDVAVLNVDDAVCRGFAGEATARVIATSRRGEMAGDGVLVRGGRVVRRRGSVESDVVGVDEIRLRGDHNVENLLSAAAVAGALGVDDAAIAAAARSFGGVAHRLEDAGEHAGVRYVNDSIATTPERTLAGIRSYAEPLVLLLGGRHKQLPLEEMAAEAARRCRAVIGFGEAGPLFTDAVRAASADAPGRPEIALVETVAEAVARAAAVARAGDVVLFSPAGTSFDAYRNFEIRGQAFRDAVTDLGARS